MGSKAENTAQFILEKVAPIFNKKGFEGTSLSDMTAATGLTKGAIYGNFQNKEDLAVKAFKWNVRRLIHPMSESMKRCDSPMGKLYVMTDYYRTYYEVSDKNGGCPVLNIGVDANNGNPVLFKAAKDVAKKLEKGIEVIIQKGIEAKEIKPGVDPPIYARNIYSMLEGCVFTAFTHRNKKYILDMVDMMERVLYEEMKVENYEL